MSKNQIKGLFVALFLSGLFSISSVAMEERPLTIEFKTERELKAYALVGHGLNTKPEVMKEVISMLNNQGITCLLVQLSGHRGDSGELMTAENWLRDWERAFTDVQIRAKENGVRFMVVAHSMGCLVNSCHLSSTENIEGLAGCIYLAPADGLKGTWKGLLPLAQMFGGQLKGMGTMFAGSNASQIDIPTCAFTGLNDLLTHADNSEYCTVPTLCFVDKNDMLIDFDYLSSKFTSWQVVELETAGQQMGHMCVYESHPGFCQIQVTVPEFMESCMESEIKILPGKKREVQEKQQKKEDCIIN